jgi:DNA helicase HerA-like ATPase
MWKQGEHVLVSGGTGSGKTRLARYLVDERLKRGGHVVILFGKMKPDDTITEHYADFTRWTRWKTRPMVTERKILLWPKVEGLDVEEAADEMHRVFQDALREIGRRGDWTVVVDDGLFMTSPSFLALGNTVSMMHMLIRSAKGTLITLVQRPAHIPVTIYPNISYAFIGRASERNDVQRLAELDGKDSRELVRQIKANGTHDFTMVTVGQDYATEQINLIH